MSYLQFQKNVQTTMLKLPSSSDNAQFTIPKLEARSYYIQPTIYIVKSPSENIQITIPKL